MRSLAARFSAPGRPLELVACEVPAPQAGEVLVAVECCTLCGSDLHTIRGDRPVPGPLVLGHEIIGRVEAIGDGPPVLEMTGQPLAIGQRITWSVVCSCRECFYCRHDLPQKCAHLFKYGHQALQADAAPSGGLAEKCLLRAGTSIAALPAEISDHVAAPANCATATVAAALRIAGDCRGQAVLIVGAGMLGLTAAAWARRAGAAEVIVTDLDPERCQLATRFGATEAMPPGDALTETIARATDRRGVDLAFDMSGSATAIESALAGLRIGGRLILVGSVFPTPPIALRPEQMVRRMLRIEGVHNYRPDDLLAAVDFLQRCGGDYPFEQLVAAEYPLSEVNQAVAHALRGDALRIAVHPD